MAIDINQPKVYRDWFRDEKQLPGWVVEWQMGRGRNGAMVVSSLRIYLKQGGPPVFGDDVVPGTPAWTKFWRAWLLHKEPPIPDRGITPELLRKVRLGTFRRRGDAGVRPSRKRAARRSRYTPDWWAKLATRRDRLRAERPNDYAKVLAEEFGLSRTNMRAKLYELAHNRNRRMSDVQPPAGAVRVSATGVQQTRRRP